MKFNKNSISQARETVNSVTAKFVDGYYSVTFLSARWFDGKEGQGRMSLFFRVNDGQFKGKTFNGNISFGLVYDGQDNTAHALVKLTALSEILGSKASQDADKWATLLCEQKGKDLVVSIKGFSTPKVAEGYNVIRVQKA